MNKDQFMQILQNKLRCLGPAAVAEILADFEDHFTNGLSRGKTEIEIAAELGNPDDIAQQYIDESPVGSGNPATAKAKSSAPLDFSSREQIWRRQDGQPAAPAAAPTAAAPTATAPTHSAASSASTNQSAASNKPFQAAEQTTVSGGALAAVILLNLFFGIPLWISIFSILFGFWVAAGSIGVAACVLFAVAILKAGMTSLILLLFALSLTALSILAVIFMVYLTKWLIMGLGAYIRWNRRLVRGGTSV
ncbi:MAG: DUF1700 domain-containing protein [Clostridiaceae bacterium]|nr:DUF1700 domain-containing protein [Clostridiaceae bacterium]